MEDFFFFFLTNSFSSVLFRGKSALHNYEEYALLLPLPTPLFSSSKNFQQYHSLYWITRVKIVYFSSCDVIVNDI